jgi:hypothetical protein
MKRTLLIWIGHGWMWNHVYFFIRSVSIFFYRLIKIECHVAFSLIGFIDTCLLVNSIGMATSHGGGKVSYFITLQKTSPRLTYQMMVSINFSVDEIVTTNDAALTYVYIHLQRKARSEELARGLMRLASSHGVTGSNIYGYDTVDSSSVESRELIEDHPGFKTLVSHEAINNENFNRWAADGYSGHNCGYNLLKSRLLARRTAGQVAGDDRGGDSLELDSEETSHDEDGAEPILSRPRTDAAEQGRDKRMRVESLDGGRSKDYFEVAMDKLSATFSSVIASAIDSSGSVGNKEREDSRKLVMMEQQRREKVEIQLREVGLKHKLFEQRRIVEEEMTAKHTAEIGQLKSKLDEETGMKAAKDAETDKNWQAHMKKIRSIRNAARVREETKDQILLREREAHVTLVEEVQFRLYKKTEECVILEERFVQLEEEYRLDRVNFTAILADKDLKVKM